jgi:hypothetical protein
MAETPIRRYYAVFALGESMQISTTHMLPNGWSLEFTGKEVEIATKTQIRENKTWPNLPDQQVSFASDGKRKIAFVTVHQWTRWAECANPTELLTNNGLQWGTALSPFPSPRESDYARDYAGIGPTLPDAPKTNVLFHGECHDPARLGWANEEKTVPGFYASIGIGDIDYADTGTPIKNMERLLRSHRDIVDRPKVAHENDRTWASQGLGDPAAVVNFSQDRVLLLATHYSGKFENPDQGVQIVLLHAPLSTFRTSVAWEKLAVDKKFHAVPDKIAFEPVISNADFSRPSTDHCLHPSLCRFKPTGHYVAVFSFNDVQARHSGGEGISGFYCALSDDCRHWSKPALLKAGFVVDFKGNPVLQHPTLLLAKHDASTTEVHGWLLYGKSDQTTVPQPYCLWGQPLRLYKASKI